MAKASQSTCAACERHWLIICGSSKEHPTWGQSLQGKENSQTLKRTAHGWVERFTQGCSQLEFASQCKLSRYGKMRFLLLVPYFQTGFKNRPFSLPSGTTSFSVGCITRHFSAGFCTAVRSCSVVGEIILSFCVVADVTICGCVRQIGGKCWWDVYIFHPSRVLQFESQPRYIQVLPCKSTYGSTVRSCLSLAGHNDILKQIGMARVASIKVSEPVSSMKVDNSAQWGQSESIHIIWTSSKDNYVSLRKLKSLRSSRTTSSKSASEVVHILLHLQDLWTELRYTLRRFCWKRRILCAVDPQKKKQTYACI